MTLSYLIDKYIEASGYGMDMWSKEENAAMSIVAEIIENYNKAEQKRLITEIMNEDAKDGLYNPKQTAVEWLLEKLEQSNLIDLDVVDSDRYYECIKQAKEMEEKQIMDAYDTGAIRTLVQHRKTHNSLMYYNDTYGSIEGGAGEPGR